MGMLVIDSANGFEFGIEICFSIENDYETDYEKMTLAYCLKIMKIKSEFLNVL